MKHFPIISTVGDRASNTALLKLSQINAELRDARARLARAGDDFERRALQNLVRQLRAEYRELNQFCEKVVDQMPALAARQERDKIVASPEFQEVEELMAAAVERIRLAIELDGDPPRIARAAWFDRSKFMLELTCG